MPDKQNENKFMAMLERKGIVRKADAEADSAEMRSGAANPRPESDFRSLIGSSAGEPANVTPAARQPIPGFSNPILPSERAQQSDYKKSPAPDESAEPAQSESSAEQPELEESSGLEQPDPSYIPTSGEPPKTTRVFNDITSVNPFGDKEPPENAPASPQAERSAPAAAVYAPVTSNVENYTDRYLDIDELYKVLSLKTSRTDTVYLIEEYLKTLPESLPDESRRDIVSRIVAASGFDYDLLMGDGVLRVKMLKDYAERFARYTDEYVAVRNEELKDLEQQIVRVRRLIENRRELNKKQFFAIEAEAQRLKDILTFISG